MTRLLSMLVALSAVSAAPAARESLRCGNALVRTGDSAQSAFARCGEPDEVRRRRAYFATGKAIGNTCYRGPVEFEEWIYQRGTVGLPASLTVEGGKVREIRFGTDHPSGPRPSCR